MKTLKELQNLTINDVQLETLTLRRKLPMAIWWLNLQGMVLRKIQMTNFEVLNKHKTFKKLALESGWWFVSYLMKIKTFLKLTLESGWWFVSYLFSVKIKTFLKLALESGWWDSFYLLFSDNKNISKIKIRMMVCFLFLI